MLTMHPRDAHVFAAAYVRRLQEEAAEDLRRRSWTRCALAASLRLAANRLDPAPLVRRAAW
jgi:hypothetical protein